MAQVGVTPRPGAPFGTIASTATTPRTAKRASKPSPSDEVTFGSPARKAPHAAKEPATAVRLSKLAEPKKGMALKAGRVPVPKTAGDLSEQQSMAEGKSTAAARMRPLKATRVPSTTSLGQKAAPTLTAPATAGGPATQAQPATTTPPTAAHRRPIPPTSTSKTPGGRTPRRMRSPAKVSRGPRSSLVPHALPSTLVRTSSALSQHSARTVTSSSVTSTVSRPRGKMMRGSIRPSLAPENFATPSTATKSRSLISQRASPADRRAPASTVRQLPRTLHSRLPVATPAVGNHVLLSKQPDNTVVRPNGDTVKRGALLPRRASTTFSADSSDLKTPTVASARPPTSFAASTASLRLGSETSVLDLTHRSSSSSLRNLRRDQGSAASWSTVDGAQDNSEGVEAPDESWATDDDPNLAAQIQVGLSPAPENLPLAHRPPSKPRPPSNHLRVSKLLAPSGHRAPGNAGEAKPAPLTRNPSSVRELAQKFDEPASSASSPLSPPRTLPPPAELGYPSPARRTPSASALQKRNPSLRDAGSSFSPSLAALAHSLRSDTKGSSSLEDMLRYSTASTDLGSWDARTGSAGEGVLLTDDDETEAMVADISMAVDLTPVRPATLKAAEALASARARFLDLAGADGLTAQGGSSPPGSVATPSASKLKPPSVRRLSASPAQANLVVTAQLAALSRDLEASRARQRDLDDDLARAVLEIERLRAEEARALELEEQFVELEATHAVLEKDIQQEREARRREDQGKVLAEQELRAMLKVTQGKLAALESRVEVGLAGSSAVAQVRIEVVAARATGAYRILDRQVGKQLDTVRDQLETLACLKAMLPDSV